MVLPSFLPLALTALDVKSNLLAWRSVGSFLRKSALHGLRSVEIGLRSPADLFLILYWITVRMKS
jgi:hypothetical protein